MRLIDADELQQIFNETSTALMREPKLLKDIEHMVRAFLMTTEMIKDAPTIEAEPVKHAKWYAPASYEPCEWCSNCHERTRWFFDEGYCPNCGARMDGDKT